MIPTCYQSFTEIRYGYSLEDDDADHIAVDTDTDNQDQILTADYNPSLDCQEDEQKHIRNAVVGSETWANDKVDEVEELELPEQHKSQATHQPKLQFRMIHCYY